MGLHDLAQHCLFDSRGFTRLAVPENGRSRDAAHDEPVSCDRTPPLEPTSCSRADETTSARATSGKRSPPRQ
jgi:hypothetical protein